MILGFYIVNISIAIMKDFHNEHDAFLFLTKGNLHAFNFLYRKYSQSVYSNIFKFIKNESLAEDILQDVFVSLWENRGIFKTDGSVGGWLFTVSYNKSIALLKKRQKEQLIIDDRPKIFNIAPAASEYDESEYQQMLQLVEEAVHQLPEKKQKVFRLCRFENKKPEEVSEELGLTVISVKDYLKQSTKMVKNYIKVKYAPQITIILLILNSLH